MDIFFVNILVFKDWVRKIYGNGVFKNYVGYWKKLWELSEYLNNKGYYISLLDVFVEID